MVAPLVVFCVTYLVIASRQLAVLKLDRPAGALTGAVAMVAVGGLSAAQAYAAIDLGVITLLLGVLLIAAYLEEARFFRLCAWLVVTRARSARQLVWGLTFVAGALSALLVNDTVCIVLTPLVVRVAIEARLPPLPYLLALASATNLGGVVAFSGNPQNMIVGAAAAGHPGFAAYLAVSVLPGALCLAANAAALSWLFRAELPTGPLDDRDAPRPGFDRALAIKGLIALALFAGLAAAGVALPGAAVFAAVALIVAARVPPGRAFDHVDWSLLLFFAGLFVVVEGLAHTGALDRLFAQVAPLIGRGDAAGDAAFVGLTVVASNLVSNVPAVLVARHWVPHMPDPTWGWIMLAWASTLAGNLTLFGSVANIIVMESAGPRGEIGFWRFLRYGVVLTALSLAIGFGVLALERALGLFALLGL
ncbi:MAG: anion transporter [Kofleriaceae bacterium]|nr:anion transporter [Kofleriaceae bacterium]MCB9571429.1 anion transporter [Kofleriaceae bacterium]